uniref:Uncharacterized protein n=1 Tax=Oryza meridionalis TaxID=40149 RepID=A0A0E0CVV0_9ORYZ
MRASARCIPRSNLSNRTGMTEVGVSRLKKFRNPKVEAVQGPDASALISVLVLPDSLRSNNTYSVTHACIDYQAPQDMGCGCQMIGEETSRHLLLTASPCVVFPLDGHGQLAGEAWQMTASGQHDSGGRSARRTARSVEARLVAAEVGTTRGGAPGGGGDWLGMMRRGQRRRRWARHDEARPAVMEAARCEEELPPAGGCGAVYGARRLAGAGRWCSGPTCRQRLDGGGASGHQPWTRSCFFVGLAVVGPVLVFSWFCVDAIDVWMVCGPCWSEP